jgi:hypothetical protein
MEQVVERKPVSFYAPKDLGKTSPLIRHDGELVSDLDEALGHVARERMADREPVRVPPAERNRLCELAELLRELTYGEMTDFVTGTGEALDEAGTHKSAQRIVAWAGKQLNPGVSE